MKFLDESEIAVEMILYQEKFGMRMVENLPDCYGPGENRMLLEWNWDGNQDETRI